MKVRWFKVHSKTD